MLPLRETLREEREIDPFAELRKLRARQVLLTHRKEMLVKANKLQFFRPNSSPQISFFEHAEQRRRGIFAGNRFGKSTIGVAEDISWALGHRPFYGEDNPLRYAGIPQSAGIRGLVIAQDWGRVRELFTEDRSSDRPGKFFEWAPKNSVVDTHRRQTGEIDQLFFRTVTASGRIRESVIMFDTVKSYKADGLSQESLDWDFVHFDEPAPKGLFTAATRGLLDRGGFLWMLLTPLREIWMYNFMRDGMRDQSKFFWMGSGEMDDNPELNEDERELFLANLSDAERMCRQKGLPLAYGNLVYDRYDDQTHPMDECPHGWVSKSQPSRDWSVLVSIDPHPQTPHAVLFLAISPTHVIFFHEIWLKCLIRDLCKAIHEVTRNLRVEAILCDPIAWIENPETGRCWADSFFENGLDVQKASKQKTVGVQEANHIWTPEFHKKVRVLSHLKNFRREITGYFFDKDNKPVDKDDHFMEAMYRMVLFNNLHYQPEDPSLPVSSSFIEGHIPEEELIATLD